MKPKKFNLHFDTPNFDKCVAFYRDKMGFHLREIMEYPNKRIAMFDLNDAVEFEFFGAPPGEIQQKPPPSNARIRLEVEDVDMEYERLMANGVELAEELQNWEWGERSFGIRVPDGMIIYFYSKIE